ncbi:MAG: MFS transporter [Acidobacteria bacterium]|nr:MFS transporter [Acidobacteriota bacterium]
MKVDANVAALGAARMADAVANSFLVVVLPLYVASGQMGGTLFGLTGAAATGVILSGFGFFNAALQPFAGHLSDRAGRRKLFVVGGLIAVCALSLVYSFAHSYVTVLLVRLGQGAAAAFTITASIALVNELSARENRGANMGTYNSLRLVGFGAGPLAAGFLVESGPYRMFGRRITGYDAAFYLAAFGALLSVALVTRLVKEPPRAAGVQPGAFRLALRASEGSHVLDPIFALGIATLLMTSSISLLSPLEKQVNARLGQTPFWFGLEFAAFVFSLSALQPIVGSWSDRWGRRRFIVAGLVLLAPATMAVGLAGSPWWMVAARMAQGIAGALVFAPALALGGDLVRKGASGAQLSVLTMGFGIGISVGQISAGFLVRWGFIVPFAAAAALALAAAFVVWREAVEPPARGGGGTRR